MKSTLFSCATVLAVCLVCAMGTGCKPIAIFGNSSPEPTTAVFKNVDITGATYAQNFGGKGALQLYNAEGKSVQLSDFAGKVVVVFFGYTQCPDVCPTTLSQLAGIQHKLAVQNVAVAPQLQVVFITLDPQRDTPQVLQAYMKNFNSMSNPNTNFMAIRPTPEQMQFLLSQFKSYAKKAPGPTPTSYTIDHFAGSYIFDKQGKIRLFVRYGSPDGDLFSDIQTLMRN